MFSKQLITQISNKLCFRSSYILNFHYNLTLYVLSFSEGKKNISTFYVISPHWHDTGIWNPSSSKTITYLLYIVNIMGADGLAMQGARASATMLLTMLNQINLGPAH